MYTRISKQLGTNTQTGSFQPMLAALKASAEKLATIHTSTLAKVNELVKTGASPPSESGFLLLKDPDE